VSSPVERTPAALAISALGAAALILAIAILFAWRAHNDVTAQLRGTPLGSRRAPDVTLVDQHGHRTPLVDRRLAATFIFFGYTHCKDACPLAMAKLAAAYRSLGEPSRVRVEMVTVDPVRDDPAAMGRYVARYDPHFVGLTGTIATLKPIWSDFGVEVDARTADVIHGESIYLLDRADRMVALYPPDVAPADLAHDARLLTQAGSRATGLASVPL
jgi:protein SCO1/2